MRNWLNSDFLNTTFTAEEQATILTNDVDNSKSQGNGQWNTVDGNNTQDRIFLLSCAEVEKYFENKEDRICQATEYSFEYFTFKDSNGYCLWWLRSPGHIQNHAAYVSMDGSWYSLDVYYSIIAVRPAFWINLEEA